MTDTPKKTEECAELFCKTIAELNEIALKQMEGLLNLAVTAFDKLDSNTAPDVAKFVDELKISAEQLRQQAKDQVEAISGNLKESQTADAEPTFCAAVENNLLMAFNNALANQQQLNVIGDAILTQAASLLLKPQNAVAES